MDSATLPIDRLTLLLDSTGEGIFGIDMDGRCTFVNSPVAPPEVSPGLADPDPEPAWPPGRRPDEHAGLSELGL